MSTGHPVEAATGARAAAGPIRAAVIGIGNPDREDDGAGVAVVRALRGRAPGEVALIECEGGAAAVVAILEHLDCVIVVDALNDALPPGVVRRFDASAGPLPARLRWSSTHAIGLGEAIELARAMHTLPPTVVVYGIAGSRFGIGESLSEPVALAVSSVAETVLRALRRLPGGRRPCRSWGAHRCPDTCRP